MNQMNRKYSNLAGKVCALLASVLVVVACGSGGGGGGDDAEDIQVADRGNGPQLSIDVEAFCGDPMAVEYDMNGEVVTLFADKVAVRLTDVSDDNGPADAMVGNLKIVCMAAVQEDGRGKPSQVEFATIDIPAPVFGVIETYCPGELPQGATEWKVKASASGGDLRRNVSDTCEEVAAQ